MVDFAPKESEKFPGYFIVPGYSKILIARDSTIISAEDGLELRQSRPIPNSYRWVKVYSDEADDYVNQSVHVLVALAFKERLQTDSRTIPNHLDGNKLNNHESNIEWTTYSGNITHAYANGLRTDNQFVLAKNIETDEIKEWYSLGECGRTFGVSSERVFNWCRKPNHVYKDKWIFKYKDDPNPWPKKDELINNADKFQSKPVIAASGKEIIVARSVSQLCKRLGITSVQSIQRQLRLYKKAVFKNWTITFKCDRHVILS